MPQAAKTHKQNEKHRFDDRPSAAKRGYGYWWSNSKGTGLRDMYLKKNPLCAMCRAQGRDEAAKHVDHIVPHRGDPKLLKDPDNLESLCEAHHNSKSAREKLAEDDGKAKFFKGA